MIQKDLLPEIEGQAPGENDSPGFALLAYIFFALPIFFPARSKPFVQYHIKQSMVIFLTGVVILIIDSVLDIYSLNVGLFTGLFIIWCVGVAHVFLGKYKPVPLIGRLAEKIQF